MPSLSDLPQKELRNIEVALKIFEENFGEIHDPDSDGNCGYYALFKAFKYLGKNLMGKKLLTVLKTQKLLEPRELSYSILVKRKLRTLLGILTRVSSQNSSNFFLTVIHTFLE